MSEDKFEIERKFLIVYPDIEYLDANAVKTEIVQTYLESAKGTTARVRKRGLNGKFKYTHTVKQRISDMRRIEDEQEISPEQYEVLLKSADKSRNVIYKNRYCLNYKNQIFEIDVFPFWSDRAVMEIELTDESQHVDFPPMISIIREITLDRRYTNAAMAKTIPMDVL